MSQRNIDIVTGLYEALAHRDLPTLFRVITSQTKIVQTPLLPWGGEYHGETGLKDFFARLLQSLDSQVENPTCFEAGNQVVAVGRSAGVVRSNGVKFDVQVVHIWTLQDEKVTRFEPYIDTPAMLAALNG